MKGVPWRQIVWRHVVPNSLLPAISVIGLTIAWLLGGVVIVESVFNYPGLGRLAVDAVGDRDLPLVQAIALLFGITYVITNLAADLIALLLNPRSGPTGHDRGAGHARCHPAASFGCSRPGHRGVSYPRRGHCAADRAA